MKQAIAFLLIAFCSFSPALGAFTHFAFQQFHSVAVTQCTTPGLQYWTVGPPVETCVIQSGSRIYHCYGENNATVDLYSDDSCQTIQTPNYRILPSPSGTCAYAGGHSAGSKNLCVDITNPTLDTNNIARVELVNYASLADCQNNVNVYSLTGYARSCRPPVSQDGSGNGAFVGCNSTHYWFESCTAGTECSICNRTLTAALYQTCTMNGPYYAIGRCVDASPAPVGPAPTAPPTAEPTAEPTAPPTQTAAPDATPAAAPVSADPIAAPIAVSVPSAQSAPTSPPAADPADPVSAPVAAGPVPNAAAPSGAPLKAPSASSATKVAPVLFYAAFFGLIAFV